MKKPKSSFYYLPQIRYAKADFPGQVYNLIVSASRHLHMLKSGHIKRQEKPFDISNDRLSKGILPDKDILFHFLIKDDHSGLFHAESYPISQIIGIESFLYRAFKPKKITLFHGYPDVIIITQSTLELYPYLTNFCKNTGIKLEFPTSGFRTPIEAVKFWEHELEYRVVSRDQPLSVYSQNLFSLNREANNVTAYGESRNEKWQSGIRHRPTPFKEPEDFEKFCELFKGSKPVDSIFNIEYSYDFDNDWTERDGANLQVFAKEEQYDKIVSTRKLSRETIKKRSGFRYLKDWYDGNFHIVYNTRESADRQISKEILPWFVQCEKHKKGKSTKAVKDAIDISISGTCCDLCKYKT